MFATKFQVVVALLDEPLADEALLVLGHTSLIDGIVFCFDYEVHSLYLLWPESLRWRGLFDDWLGLFFNFLFFLSRLTDPFARHHSACILLTGDPEGVFSGLNDFTSLLPEERR